MKRTPHPSPMEHDQCRSTAAMHAQAHLSEQFAKMSESQFIRCPCVAGPVTTDFWCRLGLAVSSSTIQKYRRPSRSLPCMPHEVLVPVGEWFQRAPRRRTTVAVFGHKADEPRKFFSADVRLCREHQEKNAAEQGADEGGESLRREVDSWKPGAAPAVADELFKEVGRAARERIFVTCQPQ